MYKDWQLNLLLTSLITIKLFIRLISQVESRRDPGERSHGDEAWRVGFKGWFPWKQTGNGMIGKSGNVHLKVKKMQGQRSQITIHYSEQILKLQRGVFSRQFKVKV